MNAWCVTSWGQWAGRASVQSCDTCKIIVIACSYSLIATEYTACHWAVCKVLKWDMSNTSTHTHMKIHTWKHTHTHTYTHKHRRVCEHTHTHFNREEWSSHSLFLTLTQIWVNYRKTKLHTSLTLFLTEPLILKLYYFFLHERTESLPPVLVFVRCLL